VDETEIKAAQERAWRRDAEMAAHELELAWRLAGLPSEPNAMAIVGQGLRDGAHVSFGGGSAETARALALVLRQYARLSGQLIDGETHSLVAALMIEAAVSPMLPSDGFTVVSRELGA
jgi:hypothetical protein